MIENSFFSIFILPFFLLGANKIHIARRQILLVGPLFEFRFPCSFAIYRDQYLYKNIRKQVNCTARWFTLLLVHLGLVLFALLSRGCCSVGCKHYRFHPYTHSIYRLGNEGQFSTDLEKKLVLEHSELPAVEYCDPFRRRVATYPILAGMGKFGVECSFEAQWVKNASFGRVNET